MNYGLLVWGIECHRLEKVQKKVLRLITNSKYIAHTNPLFCQLNLLKIKDIFKLRLLKFYYKLTCDLLPSYFNTYLDVINRAPPRQLRINLIYQSVIKRNYAKCGLLHQLVDLLNSLKINPNDTILAKIYKKSHSYNGFAFNVTRILYLDTYGDIMIKCVVSDIAMYVNDSRFIHIIYVFVIEKVLIRIQMIIHMTSR